MRNQKFLAISTILVMLLSFLEPSSAVSARPLDLGTSPTLGALLNYSVLGGAAVTNTGATTTDGAVGVSPGSSITGFPPGIAGSDNATHLFIPPAADAAQADALTLWGTLDQTCDGSSFPDLTDLSTTKIGINSEGTSRQVSIAPWAASN